MPPRFVISGGHPLAGTIRPAGNKNAALPIIAASLLADGPVTLHNIPRIRDVETLLELVADLGATVRWSAANSVVIDPRGVKPKALDPSDTQKLNESFFTNMSPGQDFGIKLAERAIVACP